MKGFRNFMMQGDLIVISVGLVVALSFSTLIKAFTDNVVTPLVNAMAGGGKDSLGLGWTQPGRDLTRERPRTLPLGGRGSFGCAHHVAAKLPPSTATLRRQVPLPPCRPCGR